MLKKKSKILLIVLSIILLFSSVCLATEASVDNSIVTTSAENSAVETTSENGDDDHDHSSTEATANWVNSDLYLSDDEVVIDNVVDGNVFIAANEVKITGEIGGDLFVVANKVTIDGGYVYSSIFACANEITINGVVYDVYAVANKFTLDTNGFVYRDFKVSGNTVNINGKIRRNAFINAKSINFPEESSDTVIYGNLNYSSTSEINFAEGTVSGDISYTAVNTDTKVAVSVATIILKQALNIFKQLVLTFVLVLLLIWLAPKFIERIEKMSIKKCLASLGIGVLAPIVAVIVSLLLLISVFGTKLFTPFALLFVVFSLIASSITSIYFGKLVTRKLKMNGNVKFVLFTLLVNLVLCLITKIPFVGAFIGFLIYAFGIGTLLVNVFYKKKKSNN